MGSGENLKREIGAFGLASGVANFIIGAGIFALPALVAIILGNSSVLAYIICGTLIMMIMLCFAEIGSQVTVSGGPYAYVHAAFGPYFGFLSNFLFWMGYCVIADAAIANAMADMLSIQFPSMSLPLYRGIFFLFMFGIFAFINIRGAKKGVGLIKTLLLIKLIPLLLIVVVGAFWVNPKNLQFGGWPSSLSLGEASILLFFAFGGGEGALSASGEISNPQKTVPRGILIGVGLVILLYLSIQTVSQGVVGAELVNYPEAPLAEVANRIIGVAGLSFIVFAAVLSIFGTLSGSIMYYPRIIYAGALQGWMPSFLSKVHKKYFTPMWAIVVYALLVFTFAISGGFRQLAILSSAALLLTYMGVALATIKFRLTAIPNQDRGFRIPGGITIPVLAVITICWFFFQLASREIISVLIFFGVLTVVYLGIGVYRRRLES